MTNQQVSLQKLFDTTVVKNGHINFGGFLTCKKESYNSCSAHKRTDQYPHCYLKFSQGVNQSEIVHVTEDNGKTVEDYVNYVFDLLSGESKEVVEEVYTYEPRKPVSSSKGWTTWNGGKCPVRSDTLVRVRFRYGGYDWRTKADYYTWEHTGGMGDIVEYQLY